MNYWNNEGVPHKGWVFVDMEDLGEFVEPDEIAYERCQMCGKERIRYVHILEHEEYGTIRVGSRCASRMEEEYTSPKLRDAECRKKAARRANFLKQDWYKSEQGNYSLTYKGDDIAIKVSRFNRGLGVYYNNHQVWEYKGNKQLDLKNDKLAAFELFEKYHEVKRDYRDYYRDYPEE